MVFEYVKEISADRLISHVNGESAEEGPGEVGMLPGIDPEAAQERAQSKRRRSFQWRPGLGVQEYESDAGSDDAEAEHAIGKSHVVCEEAAEDRSSRDTSGHRRSNHT